MRSLSFVVLVIVLVVVGTSHGGETAAMTSEETVDLLALCKKKGMPPDLLRSGQVFEGEWMADMITMAHVIVIRLPLPPKGEKIPVVLATGKQPRWNFHQASCIKKDAKVTEHGFKVTFIEGTSTYEFSPPQVKIFWRGRSNGNASGVMVPVARP